MENPNKFMYIPTNNGPSFASITIHTQEPYSPYAESSKKLINNMKAMLDQLYRDFEKSQTRKNIREGNDGMVELFN
jgi:hypothetical protein